jgi:putative hydrolase of HD superfamily
MDYYDPLDGQMVKSCDLLSAFTEAYFSLKHGIRSRELKEACNSLEQTFQDRSKQELYPFEQVLEELRQHYNWKE